MGELTVRLPSVLAQMVGGQSTHEAHGETLRAVLDDLIRQQPVLRVHLFDESGSIRRHVLCFHNGTFVRRRDSLDIPVQPGDSLTILHSVAGG